MNKSIWIRSSLLVRDTVWIGAQMLRTAYANLCILVMVQGYTGYTRNQMSLYLCPETAHATGSYRKPPYKGNIRECTLLSWQYSVVASQAILEPLTWAVVAHNNLKYQATGVLFPIAPFTQVLAQTRCGGQPNQPIKTWPRSHQVQYSYRTVRYGDLGSVCTVNPNEYILKKEQNEKH